MIFYYIRVFYVFEILCLFLIGKIVHEEYKTFRFQVKVSSSRMVAATVNIFRRKMPALALKRTMLLLL